MTVEARSHIEAAAAVDTRDLRTVDTEMIALGIACIHGYDPALFCEATWSAAEETLALEAGELARLNDACDYETDFDEAAWEFECEYLSLELGVSGLAQALCAAGCPTFASCRGHDVHRPEPWVLFAADADRLRLVERAAATTGCNLRRDDGLAVVHAPSISDTVALGRALVAASAAFDALPRGVDRAAAAAVAAQIDER